MKDINVYINDILGIKIFSLMTRKFLRFHFNSIVIDDNCNELFKLLNSHVEYMSFDKCEMCRRQPVKFDSLSFINLKILKVIDCDLWCLFSSLPNLSELYLSGKSTITDDGIIALNRTMKHLTSLSITCHIADNPKAYQRFYPTEVVFELNPSSLVLTFPIIKKFISERANTLIQLDFSRTKLSAKTIKELSQIQNLHLQKLILKCCSECHGGLIDFFKNQHTLKALNLNNSSFINDKIICAFCDLLPRIEELEIYKSDISNPSLIKIFQLHQMKKLNIGRCVKVTPTGFNEAVSVFHSTEIKYLNLSLMKFPDSIIVLVKKCSYLIDLDVSMCDLSDKHIHIISETLIHLENLNLYGNDISDYGLTGHSTEILKVRNLSLNGKNEHNQLSNLRYLKQLNLGLCTKVTDFGAKTALQFQLLNYLNVNGCSISRDTVNTLFHQNLNLRKMLWENEIIVSILISLYEMHMYLYFKSNKI